MAFEIENGVLKKYIPEMFESGVDVPEGVTVIGAWSFAGSMCLKSVVLPESVMVIEENAFWNCTELNSVTIPKSVTRIGNFAFFSCTGLTGIQIPEGVIDIEEGVFCRCEKLTSIVIPEGVTSIGNFAFNGCRKLSGLTIPESVTKIGDNTFNECRSIRLFGITFSPENFKNNDFFNAKKMIKTKDFSMKISTDIKYAAAVGFWMKTGDEAAESFIRKSISRIMPFLIENNNPDAIGKILESGKFITEKNIDIFITCAIEHTQNGGSPEIQTMLMHYKSEVTGYKDPAAQFKL